jgi:protein involved in polysaccharide export with SLBB domain
MPAILQVVTAESQQVPEGIATHVCRVSENGSITLPIIGEIPVAGRTLAEIESAVVEAYHPRYARTRPTVVARVTEYRTTKVAITGAVAEPGVYELRNDEMSLVSLLVKAGGIADERAALIHIVSADTPVRDAQDEKEPSGAMVEETVEQLTELHVGKTPAQLARPSSSNRIGLQLAFKQVEPLSTVGWLTVKHGHALLLTERLDVTSKIQRQALLEKLAQTEPWISTVVAQQRLRTLAEAIRLRSYKLNRDDESTTKKMNPHRNLIISGSNLDPISDKVPNKDTKKRDVNSAVGLGTVNPNRNSTWYAQANKRLDEDRIRDWQERIKAQQTNRRAQARNARTLVLPVKGVDIPFADVPLNEGDSVVVERLEPPLFSVIGLVNAPGNFPYPSGVRYNLLQAIGFAGGLNMAAEPRYATVYRRKADGTVVDLTYRVAGGPEAMSALNLLMKPGDIVTIEHTHRTRTKVFLDNLFNFNVGAYVPIVR